MDRRLDFLAIGDITTDAFIRLSDAWIETDNPKRERELCMRFADKIPYEFVEVVRAVGNASNAAVSAARLGLAAGLVTNLGDDENGRECADTLKKERVDAAYVSVHKGAKTNYHYVLWFQEERTILVKHEPYPYRLPAFPPPKWIYFSSLGGGSETYHDEIADYLRAHPSVRFAFQPGTFQIRLGSKRLSRLYARADVFACNREEAQKILGAAELNAKTLLDGIRALGPSITIITDGPAGAYALDATGVKNEYWFQPPYPDEKPPLSRTGAGDAFASTFIAALILGKAVPEALRWAPINSASVVQGIGAQKGLLTRETIEQRLASAPENYRPQQL